MFKNCIAIIFTLLSSIATQSQSISQLYDSVMPSVVQIIVRSQSAQGDGDPYNMVTSLEMGTGVIISQDGQIITAAHVVQSAIEIDVVFYDGSEHEARIENISNLGDVALLRLINPPKNIKIAKIGNSDQVKIGDDIFIIGFPMGLDYSLSKGIISGVHSQDHKINEGAGMEFFQTDAAINTGNSGGPMFNMNGEVIGIVSSILSRSGGFEGVGFATKINLAQNLLFRDSKFWFGIDGHYLTGVLAEVLNLPQKGGLLITSITPNSPAYFIGLRGGYLMTKIANQDVLLGGDIILSIEGLKIDSIEHVASIWAVLKDKKKNETIKLTVLRSGEIKEYKWKIK